MAETRPYTLITGASSGIGRAIAVRLSGTRHLILHGRDLPRLEAARRACAEAQNHQIWPYDLRAVEGLADGLSVLLGTASAGVEAFVHCAGVAHVLPARSAGIEAVRESLNVNYVAAQQIVATLLKKRSNRAALRNVVFISSIWSRFAARGHSLYCASKAALDGMMRALAVELAPEVRVNSILPGAVRTPMAEGGLSDPEIAAGLRRDYPLGIGEPEDVAGAVEFLLSAEARWMTGQQVTLDGGRTVNMSLK
jgi:NAD(P)-dependent dehydrogenase (short-subunit alcohol dehydrogenase family)